MLWEIAPNHILNDYKICQFHQIKSGIILYGHNAYIFTPITNNDIQSYLKILLCGKRLKYNLPACKAAKKIVYYVRHKATNHIIPCIPTIQTHLNHMLGIIEQTYIQDENTYLTILHQIYLLTFKIRYQMPLQRKFRPGNRNLSLSIHSFKGKGWYSNLTRFKQKLLNKLETDIASESIPDDLLNGVFQSDIDNLSNLSYTYIQNTCVFRDGSINSMEFQTKIQSFRQLHSSTKKHRTPHHITPTIPLAMVNNEEMRDVPTIQFLQNCVNDCMNQLEMPVQDFVNIQSWNSQFHEILELDNLKEEFPLQVLPKCYGLEKSCGHVLQVNLQEVATNTMHLTMFKTMTDLSGTDSCVNTTAIFKHSVIF